MKTAKTSYKLDAQDNFVIENYLESRPFASFFPGIAGRYGIPLWCFYVNRGQAISSFGTRDKDHAILEFHPANKAWQQVTSTGFRTFLKLKSGKNVLFYEPFRRENMRKHNVLNRMLINPAELRIEEENKTLGLKISVEYFTVPEDSYAGLVRLVTLENTGRADISSLEVLDGLPQVVPFGENNFFLKKMSRTIEAWMTVENMDKGIPFFKLSVDPADRPQVLHLKEGNFFAGGLFSGNMIKPVKTLVDPESIFGMCSDFSIPERFISKESFRPGFQLNCNKTPCSFLHFKNSLKKKQSLSFYSVIGYARSRQELNECAKRIMKTGYIAFKKRENRKLIEQLSSAVLTQSACRQFDLYAGQTYLDNIMRGGCPVSFGSGKKQSIFYLYARKHGDLERDYNRFYLQPTYYSQGNGNYRDVNQNRRSDVWFCPQIKDENIITFLSLIQTDGFNPLVIKDITYSVQNNVELKSLLTRLVSADDIEKLSLFLSRPFTPGETILFIQDHGIKIKTTADEFLNALISMAVKFQDAEHAEGYWTDHWTYNLDLLESYLSIYPENLKEIVFDKKVFPYYDSFELVMPRDSKYMLHDGVPMQLRSVCVDGEKKALIASRKSFPHLMRSDCGKGEILFTNLFNKLVCLFINKICSLDANGTGIEMEANKPNWFDALNGLPGLFGSSLCETFELKRLCLFMKDSLQKCGVARLQLAEEFIEQISALTPLMGSELPDFEYWDKSSALKEAYRHKTRLGLSGRQQEIAASAIISLLDSAIARLEKGISKAFDSKTGMYCSYFLNQPVEYDKISGQNIRVKRFEQKKLPLFLEGQMHALRLAKGTAEALNLHNSTVKSSLYDGKLKMYKVTASLKSMPEEIGRCRIFTPGWLENESIWLHMEYKYLLEMLKQGLYAEFYQEIKNTLIPFQSPARYGRSILENSSFLVSSAFPDPSMHGNGYVARLSGSTAEFLSMWLTMSAGMKPFAVEEGKLSLSFTPRLAAWMFAKKEKAYSFRFLSYCTITYYNPKMKDTFGKDGVKPSSLKFNDKDGKMVSITGNKIPQPYSEQVRSGLIREIAVYLD